VLARIFLPRVLLPERLAQGLGVAALVLGHDVDGQTDLVSETAVWDVGQILVPQLLGLFRLPPICSSRLPLLFLLQCRGNLFKSEFDIFAIQEEK
jgi:hypothetical protein